MSVNNDSTVSWERHESLYFTDGNVVLQASLSSSGNARGLLFRVHQAVLSSHSPVFSDMFIVCNEPGNVNKTEVDGVVPEAQTDGALAGETKINLYDGVPLVRMPDDGIHLESVLKVLYFQSCLPYTPRSPDYPVLTAPILELSRKYGIDRIYDQIKSYIESDWPRTLKDWDRLEKDIESMTKEQGAGIIDDNFPEPGAAIMVARRFDIPSILPAAFYHLSRLSILDDWDKARTVSPESKIQNRARRTARWRLLSAQDLRCYILARAEFVEIVRKWSDLPGKHQVRANNPNPNIEGFRGKRKAGYNYDSEDCELAERLWVGVRDRCLRSADPLALLRDPIGSTEDGDHCQTCANALRDKLMALREKIWEKLGELCSLKFD